MLTGRFNQAGALAPATGPYGRAFQAAVPALSVPRVVYPYRHPYGGWIGALVIQNVQDAAIVPGKAYNGALPADALGSLKRPAPWNG